LPVYRKTKPHSNEYGSFQARQVKARHLKVQQFKEALKTRLPMIFVFQNKVQREDLLRVSQAFPAETFSRQKSNLHPHALHL